MKHLTLTLLPLCWLFAACDTVHPSRQVVEDDEQKIAMLNELLHAIADRADPGSDLGEIMQYRIALFQDWRESYTSQPKDLAGLSKSTTLPDRSTNAKLPLAEVGNGIRAPFFYYISKRDSPDSDFEHTYHEIYIPADSISRLLAWPTNDFEIEHLTEEGDTLFYAAGRTSSYTPLLNYLKLAFGLPIGEAMGKVDNGGCRWVGSNSSGLTLNCDVEITDTRMMEAVTYHSHGNDVAPGSFVGNAWSDVQDSKGGGSPGVSYYDPKYYVTSDCVINYIDYTQNMTTRYVSVKSDLFCASQIKHSQVRTLFTEWDLQFHGMTTSESLSRTQTVDGSITISKSPSLSFGGSHTWSFSENVSGFPISHDHDKVFHHITELWSTPSAGTNCSPMANRIGFYAMAYLNIGFTMEGSSARFYSKDYDREHTSWIQCTPD